MISSCFENDLATIYTENGILYLTFKPIALVNLTMAKSLIKARLALQNGMSLPILCDTRSMRNADKAAREYFAHEGMFLIKAVCLLANHHATEALLKFSFRINRPLIPTKICDNEAEALEFLKRYAM